MRGFVKIAESKRYCVYSLYAFGLASLLTLVLFLADVIPGIPKDFKPFIGHNSCWVPTVRFVMLLYIYLPIWIISLINIILFSLTAYNIFKCQKEMVSIQTGDSQKHSNIHDDKKR